LGLAWFGTAANTERCERD